MPKNCAVTSCKVHNMLPGKRSFFQLPKRHRSPERRDAWLSAINRSNRDGSRWSPVRSATICSDHFVTGKPVKINYRHPDYVPSIFPDRPNSMKEAMEKLKAFNQEEELRAKRIRLEGDLKVREEPPQIRTYYPKPTNVVKEVDTSQDHNFHGIFHVSEYDEPSYMNTDNDDCDYVNQSHDADYYETSFENEHHDYQNESSIPSDYDTSYVENEHDMSNVSDCPDAEGNCQLSYTNSCSPHCDDEEVDPSSFLSVEIKEDPGSPAEYAHSDEFARENGSNGLQKMALTDTCNLRDRDKLGHRKYDKKIKLNIVRLNVSLIMNDDALTQFYTGLPDWNKFLTSFMYLVTHADGRGKDTMPSINQYFITLVKLCQDLSFPVIASLTECDEQTVRTYFWKWVDVSYCHYGSLIRWPDREALTENLPPVFRQKYPRLKSIIDCYDLLVELPINFDDESETDLYDEKPTKAKVFIACSPLGSVNYVSHPWSSTSHPEGTINQEGKYNFVALDHFQSGDQILVAKGCTLQEDFVVKCSAELIHHSGSKDVSTSTTEDTEDSEETNSQAPVECVVGLMRKRFGILTGVLPVKAVQLGQETDEENQLDCAYRIIRVCAALVNLRERDCLS